MKCIKLAYLKGKYNELKQDYVTLTGSTGIKYRDLALDIPGYGLVPCSMKLCREFTRDPEKLMLVIEECDDDEEHVTSKMWVTLNNIERTMGSELLKPTYQTQTSPQKLNDCGKMDLPF